MTAAGQHTAAPRPERFENSAVAEAAAEPEVVRLRDIEIRDVTMLLAGYRLQLCLVEADAAIPGSYWGDSEAGLVGDRLYAHSGTGLHSVLHESSHFICMDDARRESLHTDAQGDFAEEDAVCYLQIVLADRMPGFSRARMMQDMDAWGYTFRLGSAHAWFEHDAQDALQWLVAAGVLDANGQATGKLRTS